MKVAGRFFCGLSTGSRLVSLQLPETPGTRVALITSTVSAPHRAQARFGFSALREDRDLFGEIPVPALLPDDAPSRVARGSTRQLRKPHILEPAVP
jgi:hypothetical protein